MRLKEQKLNKEELLENVNEEVTEQEVEIFLEIFKDNDRVIYGNLSDLIKTTVQSLYNAYLDTGASNGLSVTDFKQWVKEINSVDGTEQSIIPD